MILEVDPAGPVPPYEQIRVQVAELIGSGVLPPGHRMPSIRQLAEDLGVAAGTVARAYRELEFEGLLTSRVGRGTVVAEAAPRLTAAALHDRLRAAARGYVTAARRLGLTAEQALAAVDEEWNRPPG